MMPNPPDRPTPQQIQNTEQAWAMASQHLDEVLERLVHDAPELKKYTGLSDASILFDYVCSVMIAAHPHIPALNVVEVTGAAAVTRLAQQSRGENYDMSQFETDLGKEK